MARNYPLVNNAVHHPQKIVTMLQQQPHTLRDVTTEALCQTAKVLARAGHRVAVMEIVDAAGLDRVKRTEVLAALTGNRLH